ncbi:MAG: Asp-tRNA(Asn)/Glu-tRNA(Gln) amidotransferase subunit GatC [Oscillatoriales cyanobacterium SM2_2_1]|nr:Asp-tRNA(Asn)/Glu-tRNA(Gln) amidotransferase subunit GatC [Oscillatoriales cyanobacterium SM2_2_1]
MDRDQVQHIAHLARLHLTETEAEAFTEQLGRIVTYFEQLRELDPLLENVEPTTRAIEMVNVSRPDVLQPEGDREALLDCAPDREGEFFRVPRLIG